MRPLTALAALAVTLGACAPATLPDDRPLPNSPLLSYHRVYRPGKPWRLTPDGVQMRRRGLLRTEGKPLSADAIWRDYHDSIDRWSGHYKVPAELVIAIIAAEARRKGSTWSRDPMSLRTEDGYLSDAETPERVMIGLMQISLATARAVLGLEGIPPLQVDRAWLLSADNNIRAGTSYIARQARGEMCNAATLLDPPVALAAYNAGRIARMGGRTNPWKLKQYPARSGKYVDGAIAYFNDAVAVLRDHPLPAAYGYWDYLADLEHWRP